MITPQREFAHYPRRVVTAPASAYAEIATRFRAGENTREIAWALGYSESAVANALNAALTANPRGVQ